MQTWIRAGADPRKLILWVAAYGRSYTLVNPCQNAIGAPCSGAGDLETVEYDKVKYCIMYILNHFFHKNNVIQFLDSKPTKCRMDKTVEFLPENSLYS